ncbi:hypothetical protein OF83DRAFT_793868 [Amylostereum chailletii]|nr:hypothetical protein OF83DRAFT_793868 [Amylostereum chailletii]
MIAIAPVLSAPHDDDDDDDEEAEEREMFNTYGRLSSAALLVRYGFIQDDDDDDASEGLRVPLRSILAWASSSSSSRTASPALAPSETEERTARALLQAWPSWPGWSASALVSNPSPSALDRAQDGQDPVAIAPDGTITHALWLLCAWCALRARERTELGQEHTQTQQDHRERERERRRPPIDRTEARAGTEVNRARAAADPSDNRTRLAQDTGPTRPQRGGRGPSSSSQRAIELPSESEPRPPRGCNFELEPGSAVRDRDRASFSSSSSATAQNESRFRGEDALKGDEMGIVQDGEEGAVTRPIGGGGGGRRPLSPLRSSRSGAGGVEKTLGELGVLARAQIEFEGVLGLGLSAGEDVDVDVEMDLDRDGDGDDEGGTRGPGSEDADGEREGAAAGGEDSVSMAAQDMRETLAAVTGKGEQSWRRHRGWENCRWWRVAGRAGQRSGAGCGDE